MECAQLDNSEGKPSKNVVLLLTLSESKALSKMIDAAVEKKVRGAKPIQKKLYSCLLY